MTRATTTTARFIRGHRGPIALWGVTALAWAGSFTADALNLPGHAWDYFDRLANVLTLAAVLGVVVSSRVDRAYAAMWQAMISRPPADGDDGPGQGGRVVPLQRGRGGSGPA